MVRSASAQASIEKLPEVRDLEVVCGTNSLLFTWTPPIGAEPFLASYRVYLAGATTPVLLSRATTNYTAPDLLPAHGYPFRITTVDIFGTESEGASLLAATLLPSPSNLEANGFEGAVHLTWQHTEPNDLVWKYAAYVANADFNSVAGMTPALLTRAHEAYVLGLANGTTYHLAVTAINIAGGESAEVQTVTATPNPTSGAPVLQPLRNYAVDAGQVISFTAVATSVSPTDILTFSLVGAPDGASINPTSGLFVWRPSLTQGNTTNEIIVRVSANESPDLIDAESFQVIVRAVNTPPVLPSIADKTVNELSELTFAASAPVKAPTWRGESPRPAGVRPSVTESNCGAVMRPWRATGSEQPVRNNRSTIVFRP